MSKATRLLALLLPATLLFAHHGNTAYDETARVRIKGIVTEFIWTNPHSQIYLDVKDRAGKVVSWGVETNSPGILTRAGWTRRSVKPGTRSQLSSALRRMANPWRTPGRETQAPR